jgi:imidazolonepropionase-like amidohydrolase
MKKSIAWPLLLLAISSTAVAADKSKSIVFQIAFQDVRVFDGVKTVPKATVIMQGGIIKSINTKADPLPGAIVIDGRGKTLLPGLIDSHVHIIQPQSLSQALVFGVTTELDMFMSHELAAAIRSGKMDGATDPMADFRTAGTAATSPGGHCTQYGLDIPTIDKPEKAQQFVDQRIAEGSDYIKIIYEGGGPRGVTKAVLSALIKTAHKRKKIAIVHIGTRKAAKDALEAGADGLAHIYSHGQPVTGLPGLLAQHKAFVIPTLTVIESSCGLKSGKTLAADKRLLPFLSEIALSNLKESFPAKDDPRYSAAVKTAEKAVGLLMSAGVPILAGTDAPNPGTAHGVSLHRELELLVKAGLKPTEALAAATSTPAKIFDLPDRGRIAPGLRADLLLVTGDPTSDIKASRNIVGVWQQGRRVDRQAYKAKIAEAKAAAAEARKAPPPEGSESGLVSDFEQDPGQKPVAKFGSGWEISTDSFMGGKSTAKMKIVKGGAQQSEQSLLITGNVAPSQTIAWAGAMYSPGKWPFAPENLSSNKAITFWTRGDGQKYGVMVYAKHRGYMPAVQTFVAAKEWKQFTFAWKDFDGMDGSDITAILFGRSPQPGKFEFQIDNLKFTPSPTK